MDFPLFSILYGVMALILFFLAYRFNHNFKRAGNIFAGYFRYIAVFSGLASMVYALSGIFFVRNTFMLGVGNLVAEPLFMISFLSMAVVFFYITFPQISQKKVITVGLIVVGLDIAANIIFFASPFVDQIGILHYNTPLIPALIYSIFSAAALLFLASAFIWQGIKEPRLKARSMSLGSALILFFVAGVFQTVFTSFLLYILAFMAEIVASALLFIGVLYQVEPVEKNGSEPQPQPFKKSPPPKVKIKW